MMRCCEISTPVGRLRLAGDEEGLHGISFQNRFRPAEIAEDPERAREPFREIIAQLEAYFAGERRGFDAAGAGSHERRRGLSTSCRRGGACPSRPHVVTRRGGRPSKSNRKLDSFVRKSLIEEI
jgi:hypothetical protein